jgi:haloalkane dehalogenase
VEVLRTPDERFAGLSDFPFEPHYVQLETRDGTPLRMHYLDEGPRKGKPIVMLHGQPSWSYLYRQLVPGLAEHGFRVLAPDLIGLAARISLPTLATTPTANTSNGSQPR